MPEVITSIGEILIDFLPIVEHGTTVGFRMHVGGSPYNVAMGVARLGQPSAFAGKIATDFFGRHMRAHVHAEGIDQGGLDLLENLVVRRHVILEWYGTPIQSQPGGETPGGRGPVAGVAGHCSPSTRLGERKMWPRADSVKRPSRHSQSPSG